MADRAAGRSRSATRHIRRGLWHDVPGGSLWARRLVCLIRKHGSQTMKTSPPFASSDRLRISVIIGLIVAVAIAVLSATGLETYLNQERRLVSAGHQIVTALEAYRANSPGSAKELPRALEDLLHDPRMLADQGYLTTLPVDPMTQKQDWGVIKNQAEQIMDVHSLSAGTPTWIGRILSLQSGNSYADWQFLVASP